MDHESSDSTLFPESLTRSLTADGLLAVVTVDDEAQAVAMARALVSGGIRTIELAWRTPGALDGVRAIRAEVPEMQVGMGTLLTPDQVVEAQGAGASFGVSPGLTVELLEAARAAGFPYAPGVMSPSEVQLAVAHGCRFLKYFPAESAGGLAHLQSMNAPFAHLGLRYIVLGGLNEDSAGAYLAADCVGVLGGSWIAPAALIRAGRWEEIEERARRARQRVDKLKSRVTDL